MSSWSTWRATVRLFERTHVLRRNDPRGEGRACFCLQHMPRAYLDENVTQQLLDFAREASAAGVIVSVRRYVAS